MSPVVELLIEFRQYLRASFAVAPAFFDVSLAQQDQLAIRSFKKHHRTIIQSGEIWRLQEDSRKAIVGQFRHLVGYLITILTGFLWKSDLNQLGVNICILLKMLMSLFDQSVRVISQLSGQPRERERETRQTLRPRMRKAPLLSRFLLLRLVSPSLCKYPPASGHLSFFALWYLTIKNLTDRLLANCAKRKKLAVKANRALQIRAAVWNKKVLALTLRTRRNMAASHAGSRI